MRSLDSTRSASDAQIFCSKTRNFIQHPISPEARVTRIVDGDGTKDGTKIRLHGIDLAERDQRYGNMRCNQNLRSVTDLELVHTRAN